MKSTAQYWKPAWQELEPALRRSLRGADHHLWWSAPLRSNRQLTGYTADLAGSDNSSAVDWADNSAGPEGIG
jgi:hypothetical protein